jgi:hypothetical protein
VVGRSPELYFLLGIKNPSRFDVIVPLYLNEKQIEEAIGSMRQNTVIYDKTFENLAKVESFYDFHHYRSGDQLKPEIINSPIFKQMNGMQKVYSDDYVEILSPRSGQ